MSGTNSTRPVDLELVTRLLRALDGDPSAGAPESWLHPEVVQHELPNHLFPAGVRRDRAAILQGIARGAELFSRRRSTVLNAVIDGDRVALEVDWLGTLAVPVGEHPAGHDLRVRMALFLELRGGQVIRMRNYDCYDPN